MSNLYVIAGPNGAGKTTFAKEFLPKFAHCTNFINADLIALGLAPFSPTKVQIKAGKLLIEQINQFLKEKVDFAFESTLSGKTYLSLLKEARVKGYNITIFYLSIPSAQLAQQRIKQRVKEGGHHVPTVDIKRRFHRSWKNFINLYMPLAQSWFLFDNSGLEPIEIAKCDQGKLQILNKFLYQHLMENGNAKT
ncbi:MAG: zeta toxin family protein [Candidatus Omnitrophica bacterium]|nr:zeta toxin family protein [Candidatus Omnitrophota bacterium]